MDTFEAERSTENILEELPFDTENTFKDFSSTEEIHNPLTEEFISSIGEISSCTHAYMKAMRECEGCPEIEHAINENHVKGSFGDLLSSCNSRVMTNSSSEMGSGEIAKRHKQNTASNDSSQSADDSVAMSFSSDTNGETQIDEYNCERHTKKCLPDTAISKRDSEAENGFVERLMLSLSTVSPDDTGAVDFDELAEQQMNCLPGNCRGLCGNAKTQKGMNDSACHNDDEMNSDSQENINNSNLNADIKKIGDRGCMGKPLLCTKRPGYDCWLELHQDVPNQIDSGFVTGNNKKILVDPSKITLKEDGLCNTETKTQESFVTMLSSNNNEVSLNLPVEYKFPVAKHSDATATSTLNSTLTAGIHGFDESSKGTPESNLNKLICSENTPKPMGMSYGSKEGHMPRENESDLMMEVFCNVRKHFKNCERRWVFEQFKWTWLHMFLTQAHESGNLESGIIDIMNLRLKNEHSVLRRIVEFDDVPYRFMVLGIIRVEESSVELYDGFYSLRFEIDKNIHTMLKMARCDLGSKLYVFGSDILLKKPTSIFDVEGNALKLHYNSVRVCSGDTKLGEVKKISFLNNISRLLPDGGVVSAIVVKIKKIIELKYLVTVENYRNRVDDLEKEMEKIYSIAEKVGYTVKPENITVRRFCKMMVEDESGECTLTWWSPPELKTAEIYKLVYLIPVQGSFCLHLSTSRKTYFEKVG